jgi:hypothetical protein
VRTARKVQLVRLVPPAQMVRREYRAIPVWLAQLGQPELMARLAQRVRKDCKVIQAHLALMAQLGPLV